MPQKFEGCFLDDANCLLCSLFCDILRITQVERCWTEITSMCAKTNSPSIVELNFGQGRGIQEPLRFMNKIKEALDTGLSLSKWDSK